MKTTSILALSLFAGTVFCTATATAQTAATTSDATQVRAPVTVAGPVIVTDRPDMDGHYPPPPNGVPPELHRKVVHLYKRIHNAHPDASRNRIFLKIAEELGIAPRRLWNAYHNPSTTDVRPPVVDVRRVDRDTDKRVRDARPVDTRPGDRARDRRVRADRVTDRPRVRVTRDRPVRTRPQRGG